MITTRQVGAAAPMLALVLSFATVLMFGWSLGPKVSRPGPGPPPDGAVAAAPTTADSGSAATDGPEPTDATDDGDLSEVPDGSTASTSGRQVVRVVRDGNDDEVVADLPPGVDLPQRDLRPTDTASGVVGGRVVCLTLPPGSTLDGKAVPSYCTQVHATTHIRFRVEDR